MTGRRAVASFSSFDVLTSYPPVFICFSNHPHRASQALENQNLLLFFWRDANHFLTSAALSSSFLTVLAYTALLFRATSERCVILLRLSLSFITNHSPLPRHPISVAALLLRLALLHLHLRFSIYPVKAANAQWQHARLSNPAKVAFSSPLSAMKIPPPVSC